MTDLIHASQPVWMSLGLTLAHFLWQGAAVAVLTAAALWLLRRRSPGTRYVACGLAMLLMAVCPPGTLWYVRTNPLSTLAPASESLSLAPAGESSPLDQGGMQAAAAADNANVGRTPPVPGLRPTESPVTADAPPVNRAGAAAVRTYGPAWQPWLVWGLASATFAWLLGVVVLAVRLMMGWLGLHQLRRRDSEALPETITALACRLKGQFGLDAGVPVRASSRVLEPVAFGLLRPMVLLPIAVLSQCPAELVEAMIAHELAHIRRHDLWVNVLQRVVETVLFYHPAVWWVSGRMRLERELCCDDLAIRATGRRAEYASALVELCRVRSPLTAPALAAGMFGPRLTLGARVRRVLQLPSDPHGSNRGRLWVAGPASLLVAASLIFVACLHAATPQGTPAATLRAATRPATTPPGTPLPGPLQQEQTAAAPPKESSGAAPSAKRPTSRSTEEDTLTNVRTLADGIVTGINVEPGQRIKKGDVLVRLDDAEIRIELESARARFDEANKACRRMKLMVDSGKAPTSELEQAESAARLAQFDVARWSLRMDRTRVCSPADGVVYTVVPELNSRVRAGDVIAKILVSNEPPKAGGTAPAGGDASQPAAAGRSTHPKAAR